ncbi:hypothetical protein PCANC_11335 [Puccinia coronata f. sp. avenae]|uniref:Uncharacterized protein n=1 Tax=Puccinia coronata f. sp. avenae TaxID=200324 RepID=A0A2N5VT11_9BASI|nr:hypothetical protein PCANC_11335 [Puccinia coronata f. sp. avenae]
MSQVPETTWDQQTWKDAFLILPHTILLAPRFLAQQLNQDQDIPLKILDHAQDLYHFSNSFKDLFRRSLPFLDQYHLTSAQCAPDLPKLCFLRFSSKSSHFPPLFPSLVSS